MNTTIRMQLKDYHRANGFSLIELLMTLVIASILTAISVRMYSEYVIKSNRTLVQSQMSQIAQKLSGYKLANNTYNVALTSGAIYGGAVFPATGTPLYDLELDTATVVGAWTLKATPRLGSKQEGDGVVLLNDQGWQCWTKTSTLCLLSATSKW